MVIDTNPFLREISENLLRVTLKDVPPSVNDEVIIHELEGKKCKVRENASEWSAYNMFEHAATGFCCTLKARETLDRHVGLALFMARIYHDGQTPGAMPRDWLSCANVRQGICMQTMQRN